MIDLAHRTSSQIPILDRLLHPSKTNRVHGMIYKRRVQGQDKRKQRLDKRGVTDPKTSFLTSFLPLPAGRKVHTTGLIRSISKTSATVVAPLITIDSTQKSVNEALAYNYDWGGEWGEETPRAKNRLCLVCLLSVIYKWVCGVCFHRHLYLSSKNSSAIP